MTQRIVHLYLMAVALLVTALITSAAALAGPVRDTAASAIANPLLLNVRNGCVRHVRLAHGEALVNRCGACMVVGVTRKRRGIPAPEVRQFTIQANATLALPFKGPGRTTVGSTYACSQANLAKPETLAKEDPKQKCISLQTDRRVGAVYLFNACHTCRAASLMRFSGQGRNMGKDGMLVGADSNVRIPPNGAAHVVLLGEQACPHVLR